MSNGGFERHIWVERLFLGRDVVRGVNVAREGNSKACERDSRARRFASFNFFFFSLEACSGAELSARLTLHSVIYLRLSVPCFCGVYK